MTVYDIDDFPIMYIKRAVIVEPLYYKGCGNTFIMKLHSLINEPINN